MVIDASDSYLADAGLVDDAPETMPLDGYGAMPDGDDEAAPSDGEFADEAATEDAEVPFDLEALTDRQRAYLQDQFRQQLATEYETKFKQDKANLQRAKDQEIARWQKAASENQFRFDAAQRFMADLIRRVNAGEYMPDERDLAAFENSVEKHLKQQDQAVQQSQQSFQSWAQGSIQRMVAHVQQQAVDETGNQLFDPQDPEIVAAGRRIYEAARRYAQTGDPRDHEANNAAYLAHRELIAKKREEGIRKLLPQAAKAQRVNQQAAAARQRQRQRGPQDVGRGGGGGGAGSGEALMAAIRAEFQQRGLDPDANYNDVFDEYLRRKK